MTSQCTVYTLLVELIKLIDNNSNDIQCDFSDYKINRTMAQLHKPANL